MRIISYNLDDSGGGLANYRTLLRTMAIQYPEDHHYIVCLGSANLVSPGELGNATVIQVGGGSHKELVRLRLGIAGLHQIAKANRVDVMWCINVGPYVRTAIPQVLSVANAFQVYPWSVTRYHSANSFHVAALRWFFRRTLRSCDGVHVQTHLMKAHLSRIKGAPSRIAVIPKAVESLDDGVPSPLPESVARLFESGLGKDTFTFLYVATGEPHKNHKTLVSAMGLLRSSGVRARIALTLTEDQLVRSGGSLARELVEGGYIVPLGWVSKEHLRPLYDASSACVMPSVLESLSSAHLEAMHWRRPQVCADLPYARDLCGQAAIYAAAEDPSQWAGKMQAVLHDDTLRSRLLKAGVERMKDYPPTWQEVARRIRDFLAEVVAATRKSAETQEA